jgi:hypothetical protein
MFTIIGLCLSAPFVVISDWFSILNGMQPLQRELSRASQGVMMVIIAGYAFHLSAGLHLPDYNLVLALYGGLVFLAGWGVTWFMVGATRSRGYLRDVHLMIKSAARIGLGIVLFYIPYAWKPDDYRVWFDLVQHWAEIFCIVTGATKCLLLLRPPPRLDRDEDGDEEGKRKPHGGARFGKGGGLRQ